MTYLQLICINLSVCLKCIRAACIDLLASGLEPETAFFKKVSRGKETDRLGFVFEN
jgi:hypothetical protein